MEILSVFLTIKESIVSIFQVFSYLRGRGKSKVTEDEFNTLASKSFDTVRAYLRKLGLSQREFSPGKKADYIIELRDSIKQRDNFRLYSKGEIESFFFDNFNLPDEERFKYFAKYSFFLLEGFEDQLRITLWKERIAKWFTRKKTAFHYMSISGWATLDYKKLISQVKKIQKPKPLVNERFGYQKIQDIEETMPTVSKAIDAVLESGKISERTVLNLASSEKLLMIHKYGEGFTEIYTSQNSLLNSLKAQIEELENSDDPNREAQLHNLKQRKKNLTENWVRTPIGTTLEELGFQKLFSKMSGVYIYPLMMLPEKYHTNHKLYVEEVVLRRAQHLLRQLKENEDLLSEYQGGPKYILLAHVVPLNEIDFFTRDRELSISSPILYRLLFQGYLFRDSSDISSIYVNDIVRNIDILNFWKKDTESAKYLTKHFELLKQLLWDRFKVEIYRPISLISLTEENIGDICEQLHKNDSSLAPHYFRKLLIDTIDFYKKLNEELDAIKLKKVNK